VYFEIKKWRSHYYEVYVFPFLSLFIYDFWLESVRGKKKKQKKILGGKKKERKEKKIIAW
jgi:hypothetical protein